MRQVTVQGSGSATGQQLTRPQMDALILQRSELKDQLVALTKRRNALQEQMLVMPPPERGDHALRIKEIDQRASDIDRALIRLDVQIANGLAQPLVEGGNATSQIFPGVVEVPPSQPRNRDAQRGIAFGGSAFAIVALYMVYRGVRRIIRRPTGTSIEGQSRRLDQLQQSVDVIALEVERMSESQRFVAKVLNEKFPALGIGGAQPVSAKAADAAKV